MNMEGAFGGNHNGRPRRSGVALRLLFSACCLGKRKLDSIWCVYPPQCSLFCTSSSKPSADVVQEFLLRGAKKAVDIIYDAVGPVGPPVRPGSGSLFIVDERRLKNWRDDGSVLGSHPFLAQLAHASTILQLRLRTAGHVLLFPHCDIASRSVRGRGGVVQSGAPPWAATAGY